MKWKIVYYDDKNHIDDIHKPFDSKEEAERFLIEWKKEYMGGYEMKVLEVNEDHNNP